jgi:hypothetical protein
MPRFLFLLAALILGASQEIQAASDPEKFPTESSAQNHCPKDTVVWLNLPTMIWHYKGQRWYAHTKNGAYVCMKEAAAVGARATRNGD